MASSARGESNHPYGDGLGTGGKFRKRPFRRPQTTPYDRPPTAARNPGLGNRNSGGEGGGGGWLSKLMDPAQRLITYSAHRLFSSVFRKRLTLAEAPSPPPPPQQQQLLPEIAEAEQGTEAVVHGGDPSLPMKNDIVQVEAANASKDENNIASKDGISELEQILSQKTFTRSEIDRLTTLLRSKTADSSAGKEEQRSDEMNLRLLPSHDREKEFPHNLARENGNQKNNLISTPVGSSGVHDECIASPAELAKAYMGSRPSEVSPSMLGLRGQVVREDSIFLSKTPIPPKSPMMSLVPRSSGQVVLPENGFTTPRSRGRSAVYNMARTPYSRPQSAAKVGSFLSASQSAWEESIPSGSRQSLKRRSSVLENDIGSVGPVRRIRQKSNLLSSRSLSLPASESTVRIRASAGGFSTEPASSSKQVVRHNITHTSKASADNIPSSSLHLVPSKSSEMASKILQQLDKLVSTREKSPTKLSPSMLHGPALKSLQNVDSSKFLENLQDGKSMGSVVASYQKQDKPETSGSKEFLALPDKPSTAANGTDETVSNKDKETGVENTFLPALNSMEQHPPKKRVFRMSAHEDFLELDDDNGTASAPATEEKIERKEKPVSTKEEKIGGTNEALKREGPLTSSEAKPSAAYTSTGGPFHGNSNGSMDTARSTEITFASSPSAAVQPGGVTTEPIPKFGSSATEQSNVAPAMFTSGVEVDSLKEPSKSTAVFGNVFSSSTASEPLDQKSMAPSNTNLKRPSSFATGTSDALLKPPDFGKNVGNNASEAGSLASAGPSANGSIFSFGATAASSSPNNGSIASSPSFLTPKISNLSSDNIATQSTLICTTQSFAAPPAATSVFGNLSSGTSTNSSSTSISQSAPASPIFAASPFKFGESVSPAPASASTSELTVSASAELGSKETNVKDSPSGNLTSVSFGGMASTAPSMATSVFANTSSANKSTPGAIFGSSSATVTNAGSNSFTGTSSVPFSTADTSSGPSSAVGATGSGIFGVMSSTTSASTASVFSGTSASTSSCSIFSSSSPALTSASTGGSIFGFTAGGASAASSQSQASSLFGTTNAQTDVSSSGTTGSTQNTSFQFGSSASTPSFGFPANTSFASSSSPFGSSTTGSTLFSSPPTPQLGSSSSSLTNSASSSSTTTSTVFGSNWQTSNSSPVFGSSFNSSTPSFPFGGSSGSATGSSFCSSAATPSSSSIFTFNSSLTVPPSQPIFGSSAPAAATPSQPVFGGLAPGFSFNAPPPITNSNYTDQMNMEDSMAEDTEQTRPSMVPMFGQPPVTPPQPSFAFGAAAPTPPPSGANPFQFGSQHNAAAAPQGVSQFQASGSLEFNGGGPGGSFSLGSTGGDKSGRRIVKINRNRRTKK